MPSIAPRLAPLLLLLASVWLPAQTKEHSIGTLGANVDLDSTWKRQKIAKDLGEDQFNGSEPRRLLGGGGEMYCVVAELQEVLENLADFRRALDEQTTVGHDAEIEVLQEERWTRATRSFTAELGGAQLAFRCDLLVRDGLAYHLMQWSLRSQQAILDRRAQAFRAGFEFPGPATAWGKGLEAKTQRVTIGAMQLSFAVRPTMLQVQAAENDELCLLASSDGHHRCAVFEAKDFASAEKALDGELRTLRDWDATFAEVSRSEVTIDGVPCRTLVGATATQTFKVLLVPAGPKSWFVVRYQATGTATDLRPAREALFASVQRRQLDGALQLPPLDKPPTPAAANRQSQFVNSTRLVHEFETWSMSGAQPLADGAWLLWDWQHVYHLTTAGCRTVFASEERRTTAACQWGNDWLLIDQNGSVSRLRNGSKDSPTLFSATCVAVLGADLLLVRSTGSPLRELLPTAVPARQNLIRRTKDGKETNVAALGSIQVEELATEPKGNRVLLRGSQHDALGTNAATAGLWSVDLDTGSLAAIGTWDEVTAIAAAEPDWLVAGRPTGRAAGLWHLRSTGECQPLVTGGELRGLSLLADRVTFLAASGDGHVTVREATLAQCTAQGRNCQPFTREHLETIGSQLVAQLGPTGAPRTAADVAAARKLADQLAMTIGGSGLPDAAADIDHLVSMVLADWNQTLAPTGRILLNVLISHAAITKGAEWVPAASSDWVAWHTRTIVLPDSAFATLHNPCNLLSACLDDSEGDSEPTAQLCAAANGRVILLGLEPHALRERAAALVPTDLATATTTADLPRLRSIFASAPGNTELRTIVYATLAADGRLTALEEFAREWANGPTSAAADALAWLGAWQARDQAGTEAQARFDAAMQAVQRLPREAALYWILGRAAQHAFPDQPLRARQGYERVLALQPWGNLAALAKQALAELDGR